MANSILIFLFLFVNYLNPVSIYLTLGLNIFFLFSFFKKNDLDIYSFRILLIAFLLVLWCLIVMIFNKNFEGYVFGKYFRVLISTVFIINICFGLSIKPKQINNSLSFIFLTHCAVIGLQLLFPVLDLPIANFFQFDREAEVITEFSIRKLGLSSSYDTAALISVAGMIFFFMRYKLSQNKFFIVLSFLSLLTTIFISRTGMLLGIILFFIIYVNHYITSKKKDFFVTAVFFVGGIFILIKFILPIIASSTDTFLTKTSFNTFDNSNRDYTEGTVSGLTTGSHLNAIKMADPLNLFVGFGIDPNKLDNMQTDIGYIKIIYHVGIVGLVLILFLYWYIFKTCLFVYKSKISDDTKVIVSFLLWYIGLILIFNYKSLELYSRGTHDLVLILFFVLVQSYYKEKKLWREKTKLSY